MNSLCAIDSGLINLPITEVATPNNFTAKYNLNIPLDNDPDLILHYPFNSNIYNYGSSTSLSTNRGPNTGVQDATIVGSTDIYFLVNDVSIFKDGTSAYNDFSGNLQSLLVDPKLTCLYTFEPMDVSGTDPSRRVKNQANGVYDLLLDTGVIIDGTENIPNDTDIGSIRNTAADGNLRTSFNSATSFSIGSWVYYTTNTNTQLSGVFLGFQATSGNSQIWIFKYSTVNSLTFRIVANDLSGGSTYYSEANVPMNINSWNFFTWVATSTSWTIYMNGTTYISGVNMNFGYVRTSTPVFAINATFNRNYIGKTGNNFKDGKIDNFFIYNNALTASQVAVIYSKGQVPIESNYYYTVPIQYYQPNPYFSMNSIIPANTNGYTFSFWFNLKNTTGVIFSFANALSTNNNRIFIEINGNQTKFSCDTSNILVTTNFTLNKMYHLAWTLNTTNQSNIYVNGNIIVSNSTTIPYKSFISNYNWIMADTNFPISNTNGMAGYVNDFRYYNRILDSAEIKQLSNTYDLSNNTFTTPFKLNTDPSLCVYYTFDTSNNYVTNYAPNNYGTIDASYINGAYANYTDLSYIGTGGLKLKDTNSGYVKFGSNSIVTQNIFLNDISGIGTGISFSCWFASYNSGDRSTIFDFGQGSDLCANLIKVCISNNNIGAIIYRADVTSNSQLSTSGTNYNDGVMRHLVWTLAFPSNGINSNNSSTWNIYVNNSIDSTASSLFFPETTNDRTSCYLGKSNLYSTDPSFNGYIDDFRIYKRVLSSTDISSIYHYKSNTINTLFAKSSLLSWTPPIRYPNTSYNYYYTDNSLNITYNNINISPSNNNNTTIPNLDPENGLTYYVKSIVGNRPTSYISF